MTVHDILPRLENVKGGGGQWSARCPAHEDKQNSLSIASGSDGRVLFNCHAGCDTASIVAALGLTVNDLFAGEKPRRTESEQRETDAKDHKEAEYIYFGADRKPLLKKVKIRQADGKKYFFWQHLENGIWSKGRGDVPAPLYTGRLNLSDVQLPESLFIVEGEKDVETIQPLGLRAVSLPDGAKSKWREEYTSDLRGRNIYIIPDHDAPGKQAAQEIAERLHNEASSVKVLDLSTVWPEIPEHGDFSDMAASMGAEEACAVLLKLAANAAEWKPSTADDPFLSCFKTLDDFEEEVATWLIPGWIPESQITLMAADGGTGKTTLWCNLIAAISSGQSCILDPPGHTRKPQTVAFLTTEDSVRKKLRKKLRLAGANMANIITPDFLDDKNGALRGLKFGSHEMERFIRYFRPALCVFDPVQGFIPPEINMGSRNAMRDCMAPLISLGEECGTTFLVVCHTNKRKGAYGRDRIADSADLWDISRSVLMAGYTEEQGVRYLSNEKNNYTQLQETLLFTIDEDGQPHAEGNTFKRDREYMQAAAMNNSAPKREDCKEWIIHELESAGGSMPTKELENSAKLAGYSYKTVRSAKEELKAAGRVKYLQRGNGKEKAWYIQLCGGSERLDGETLPF